ncbi:MAG: hypothetical protein AAF614_19940 [Chloroflexota bacterium]
MPVVKVPDQILAGSGHPQLPEVIDPKVYLEPFFEWLEQSAPNGVVRSVRLRLTWLNAPSFTESGIVNYGELGPSLPDSDKSLKLAFHPLHKLMLTGQLALYQSNERHNPDPLALGKFPFNPDTKNVLEIKIFRSTSQIELTFLPGQEKWLISPHYAATSNLLYGIPIKGDVPIVKPMILLGLSKHQSGLVT